MHLAQAGTSRAYHQPDPAPGNPLDRNRERRTTSRASLLPYPSAAPGPIPQTGANMLNLYDQAVPTAVPMLDLSRQFSGLREEILTAITEVLDAQTLILGPAAERFEREAAVACGSTDAVGCASGTDALWLSMAAARIGPGDAVLTTPFSFFATVSSILRVGATPVLADIDPQTFNLSPPAVEQAIADLAHTHPGLRLRALLPVHLYGQCADVDGLGALCRQHNLLLLEDAAQAFGATWCGRPAGSLGDAAAFSFYPTKNLSAAGDAGLLTTSSPTLAERSRMLRSHGMRRRYTHDEVGWNTRLDGMQAAILSVKLRHLSAWNRRRAELAGRYDQLLKATGLTAPAGSTCTADGLVLPWVDPRAGHVFHQYVLRVPQRDALREHLARSGIASEIYYPTPLHQQPAVRDLFPDLTLPESERATREVLALPIFPELLDEEQDRVVAAIASFFSR